MRFQKSAARLFREVKRTRELKADLIVRRREPWSAFFQSRARNDGVLARRKSCGDGYGRRRWNLTGVGEFRFNVAVTDWDWFSFLRRQTEIDEVNFWQPSPTGSSSEPGTPWLFKLHAPRNVIVGGGYFAYYTRMPLAVAWEAFGIKNGVRSLREMQERVARYRKIEFRSAIDVGCAVLSAPFFFEEDDWLPAPEDWKPNIVKGRYYHLRDPIGARLWESIQARLARPYIAHAASLLPGIGATVQGNLILTCPRLGQGAFRLMVTDAYGRQCAVTGERTLPALDAAHIRPFAEVRQHDVRNGLLLRSDIHNLFDLGYVTVTPEFRFEVSRSIRDEFENGREYYALHGKPITLPRHTEQQPDGSALEWHAKHVFRE